MKNNYKEIKELKGMIDSGNTFDLVTIKQNSDGYYVIFKLNASSFYLRRQKRKDRQYANPMRLFKSIDTAVKTVRDDIGYKGIVIIGGNDDELYGFCFKLLDDLNETNPDLLKAYLSKADN